MIRGKRQYLVGLAVALAVTICTQASAQVPQKEGEALGPVLPFTVEGYYKIKWGHFEEFLDLFKRNHWPVLQEGLRIGAILDVSVASPRFHASEDGRWDLRVTIVWRNPIVATSNDTAQLDTILQRLFPNREQYERDEKRRFELIQEHVDVPVFVRDTTDW